LTDEQLVDFYRSAISGDLGSLGFDSVFDVSGVMSISLPLWKVEGYIRTHDQKLRRVGPSADWGGIDQFVGQGNSCAL
jgi:hypothetical protein